MPVSSGVPVIILIWNGWEDSFECLRSLNESTDVGLVWLVDNASSEDRSEEAKALRPDLRCVRLAENYGFAGGYNRALRMARTEGHEFAYLLNNDAVVSPGFLSSAATVAMSDSNLGSVGSVILYEGTRFVEHDGTYHARGTKPWRPTSGNGNTVRLGELRLRRPAFTSGAGMLVRLEAMDRFGYFDERFFFCWEDAEWCWRLERHGGAYSICPNSIVFHKGGRSDRNGNAIYYRTRNRVLLLDSESRGARRHAVRRLLYDAAVRAEFARREGDWVSWMALAEAIDDAFAGRFGRRSGRVGFKAVGRIAAWSVIAHGHDKLRALRGLPPGYGKASHCS